MRALTGRRGAATLVAALAVLGLVAGACGGGRSDSADDTTSSSASTGDSASTDGAMFGDLASPCGPGTPSGAPDKGVTAEAINIGYGDDAGYQATPGRGHEATDAVKAMIAWCNEQGGINGRTLVGNYYDAKITEVNNVMTEACAKDFVLVGQAWALIAGAETIRQECGLPTVPAITTGADVVNAPLMATPIPQPVDYNNVAGWAQIAEKFPEEVKKTAIMQPNFPAVIDYTQRFERLGAHGRLGVPRLHPDLPDHRRGRLPAVPPGDQGLRGHGGVHHRRRHQLLEHARRRRADRLPPDLDQQRPPPTSSSSPTGTSTATVTTSTSAT